MVGLIDIAKLSEKVSLGEHVLEVRGISAEGIAHLLNRYPDIVGKIFSGRAAATLEAKDLISLGPQIVGAIIAMGCGFMGDEEQEKAGAQLPIGDQLELLIPIFRLTFPKGVGPFVEQFEALSAQADAIGWDQATKSRAPSKRASPTDGLRKASGDQLRAS